MASRRHPHSVPDSGNPPLPPSTAAPQGSQPSAGSSARRSKSTTGKPARSKAQAISRTKVAPEERHAMIREAAYLRAERRGFSGGSEVSDWLSAEREVDELLGADIMNSAQ